MTRIDLEEGEILLRKYYNLNNLTNNEILYMKILDIMQEGLKYQKLNMMLIVN